MIETRCAARPSDLVEYARVTDDVVWHLRDELHHLDLVIETYLLVAGGPFRMAGFADRIWRTAFDLEDMASWVSHVGWAFAVAGAGGDSTTSAIVAADAGAVNRWLARTEWMPGQHLRPGAVGEWLRVLDPRCIGFTDAGYRGSGFVVGPDGRAYPLVAPFVRRDGVEYHADAQPRPGEPTVLDLDGRDPGWTTVDEQIGVERWRDEPNALERVMSALGSSAGFRPLGSAASDVDAVVITPGMAPTFGAVPDRPPAEPSPPAYVTETAPPSPPPGRDDTRYPDGNPKAGAVSGVTIAIDALAGATADDGSFDAFDITFQQNADGRVRALYKRVYVGFDDGGHAGTVSTWVTGPERNDQVIINYAP